MTQPQSKSKPLTPEQLVEARNQAATLFANAGGDQAGWLDGWDAYWTGDRYALSKAVAAAGDIARRQALVAGYSRATEHDHTRVANRHDRYRFSLKKLPKT